MAEEETVLEDYWLFRNGKGLPVAVLDSEPEEGIIEYENYALQKRRVDKHNFECTKKHWAMDEVVDGVLPAYLHGTSLDDPWEQIGTIERIDKIDYDMCIAFGLCKDG